MLVYPFRRGAAQQIGRRNMHVVRGMVQVGQTTYRIVGVGPSRYDAVRILDDRSVGSFVTEPRLEIVRSEIDLAAMTEVGRAAIRLGRVGWPKATARRVMGSLVASLAHANS